MQCYFVVFFILLIPNEVRHLFTYLSTIWIYFLVICLFTIFPFSLWVFLFLTNSQDFMWKLYEAFVRNMYYRYFLLELGFSPSERCPFQWVLFVSCLRLLLVKGYGEFILSFLPQVCSPVTFRFWDGMRWGWSRALSSLCETPFGPLPFMGRTTLSLLHCSVTLVTSAGPLLWGSASGFSYLSHLSLFLSASAPHHP